MGHMFKMASGDKKILVPTVKWAQRANEVYLTIECDDIKHPKFELTKDELNFSCAAGVDDKEYAFKLEFFKEVDPEKSKHRLEGHERNIPCVLVKTEDGFWDRLTKEQKKYHWIKTDFDKWADEVDSDYENSPYGGGKDTGFEDMMSQMSSFQQPVGDDDFQEEEDSDDEELPDLE